jgi:hypothetical protein
MKQMNSVRSETAYVSSWLLYAHVLLAVSELPLPMRSSVDSNN